jgi:hypothetical protein
MTVSSSPTSPVDVSVAPPTKLYVYVDEAVRWSFGRSTCA